MSSRHAGVPVPDRPPCSALTHNVSRPSPQAARLPHLGDLVRVAKVLLKEWELDKVFTGGLSSWNVVQLAICHLLVSVLIKITQGGMRQLQAAIASGGGVRGGGGGGCR